MPRFFRFSFLFLAIAVCTVAATTGARAQDAPPPAYFAVVDGEAMLERDGQIEPAMRDMPFVPGDRLQTTRGRVQIEFADGSAIEVAEDSIVECVSPTRVRLVAGTMDHLPRRTVDPGGVSASYLPSNLQPFGTTFDRYGSWQYAALYGYVWYPTVRPDWRPYYYGRWSAVPTYGWTWIGDDPWAYPTHHYGRWGYGRNAWFWIPGRTWGAAWVSWGAAADYVSWCPLGWNNRPVFALSVGYGRPWDGWTVMSRSHFGVRGYDANRYGFDSRRFDRRTVFVQQANAPAVSRYGRQANGYRRSDAYRSTDQNRSNADRRATGDAAYRTDYNDRRGTPGEQSRTPEERARRDGAATSNDQRPAPTDRSPGVAVPRRAYPIEAPRGGSVPATGEPGYRRPTPQLSSPGTSDGPRSPESPTSRDGYRALPRSGAPPVATAPPASAPTAAQPEPSAPPTRDRPSRDGGHAAAGAPAATPGSGAADGRQSAGAARERGAGDRQPATGRRPR